MPADPFAPLIDRLLGRAPFERQSDEERHEAAEQLHALGTAEALARLDGLPGHAEARAILRDARWDVPGAGEIALLGSPDPVASIAHVVRLRLRRAARHLSNRWAVGVRRRRRRRCGRRPDWRHRAVAGARVASLAERRRRARPRRCGGRRARRRWRRRGPGGGRGRGAIGTHTWTHGVWGSRRRPGRRIAHALARAVLGGMFGRDVPVIGGWIEGLVLGAAAGLGYGLSTPRLGGGLAAPRGPARLRTAIATGWHAPLRRCS